MVLVQVLSGARLRRLGVSTRYSHVLDLVIFWPGTPHLFALFELKSKFLLD